MSRAAIRHASETIAAGLLVTLEIICIGVYIAGVILGIGLACGAI